MTSPSATSGADPVLGIDVGGTAIKVAAVARATGEVIGEVVRVPTPQPATPDAVASAIAIEVNRRPSVTGPVGCAVPAVVHEGITRSAANIDASWIGCDVAGLLSEVLGRTASVVNDADAAGVAEMRHGAGRARSGVVLAVTLGTGIGTALFVDGLLVPNTELGHIEIDGCDAETLASERTRINEKLSWTDFASRVDRYL
jgi:polyphosphate glucokinase